MTGLAAEQLMERMNCWMCTPVQVIEAALNKNHSKRTPTAVDALHQLEVCAPPTHPMASQILAYLVVPVLPVRRLVVSIRKNLTWTCPQP
jgi:hypothetical protein